MPWIAWGRSRDPPPLGYGPGLMMTPLCVPPYFDHWSPVSSLLDVEISGWRNELRLRVFDASRRRRPHVEVFQPSSTVDDDGRQLADDRWHTVSVGLSSTASGVDDSGFFVRVHVDCVPVAGRRVYNVRLPWTRTSDFDDLSYVWIGQRTATESVLKVSRSLNFQFTQLVYRMPVELGSTPSCRRLEF